jgi:DNA-binding GntR family transcriptional regulator
VPHTGRVLPKYQQIAGSLRTLILQGELTEGDEIPSERQLAEAWQVARPTAARAVGELRRWGLVESRQGAGTFVSVAATPGAGDAPELQRSSRRPTQGPGGSGGRNGTGSGRRG